MTVRTTLTLVLVLVLGLAAPAAAADLTTDVSPKDGVRLGNKTKVSGQATEGGLPLPDRTVTLEVREHPFSGDWKRVATKQTDAEGRYEFAREFKRNHQVRVQLDGVPPQPETVGPVLNAYVLPAFTLAFKQRSRGRIRIAQTYTVPKRVELSAPTRFYVGPCKPGADDECTAPRAPFAEQSKTRKVRAGRYVAKAIVRIPASFEGRFSYVSCFSYSKGSGMGDPDQRCPRKSVRLQR